MTWQQLDPGREFISVSTGFEGKSGFAVCVAGRGLLAEAEGLWQPRQEAGLKSLGWKVRSRHLLGQVAGVPVRLLELDEKTNPPDGFAFQPLESLVSRTDEAGFALLGRALQVLDWHRNHRFCGFCGKPTLARDADRSKICEPCNRHFYPRLAATVSLLVTRGEQLLLARRSASFGTLASLVEPGESMEETAGRLARQAAGIQVRNIRYFGSQVWPFPNLLVMGFSAEYLSGELARDAEAEWFHCQSLPNISDEMPLAGRMIEECVRG